MTKTNTDVRQALEMVKSRSEDPITKVGCIIFDKTSGEMISAGANVVIESFRCISDGIVPVPLHPLKKLVMRHAEETALNMLRKKGNTFRYGLIAVCSLQPCMNCVRQLAGIVDEVYWLEDNRHQADQELMLPVIHRVFSVYRRLMPEELVQVWY
jgi:deoxycytidylate deaminase